MALRFSPSRGTASIVLNALTRGLTGAAATISAGTNTALVSGATPTVSNSGSSSAATFDFGIPVGLPSGLRFTFSTTTTDADPGAGIVRFNSATISSVTEIYVDNVEFGATDISAILDLLDDPTATASALLMFVGELDPTDFAFFKVTGAVTDETGYRKIIVSGGVGSANPPFADAARLSMSFALSADNGVLANVVEDTSPQLGGFLDTNARTITFSQGSNVASVAGDTDIWAGADGNTVHITGTNAITDFGTPARQGDFMFLVFDAAASVVDSATITVMGNANYTAAANDVALVYALTTSTFLFMPFALNSGKAQVQPSDAAIKTAYENNSDTNEFSDAEQTLLGNQSGANTGDETTATTSEEGISEHATSAEYAANSSNVRSLESNQVWDAMAEAALTSTSNSVAWNMSLGIDFDIDTLGENTTIANPSSTTVGKKGRLRIVQDATGSRTVAWGTSYEFAGGTAPTASTAANSEDIFYYDVISSTRIVITSVLDIS